MKRFLLSILLCAAIPAAAFAEVKLFLYSNAPAGSNSLTVGSIAQVEGDAAAAAQVRAIQIPERILSDGYIDRSELFSLISRSCDDMITIYGNGVRVEPGQSAQKKRDKISEENMLHAGDAVEVVINRRGVSIEIIATALADAKPGDRVNVKFKNSRQLRGILNSSRIVEVQL